MLLSQAAAPSDEKDAGFLASVATPNVFAVLLQDRAEADALRAVNGALKEKGFTFVGAAPVAHAPHPVTLPATLLVYFTYRLAGDADIVDARNAKLAASIARMFRRRNLHGWLLGRAHLASLETAPEVQPLIAAARRGDRDLSLADGEALVKDLSQNRVRSTTWLVRRGDLLLVRKAYGLDNSRQIENELAARDVLRDLRVVEISDRRGAVLYLPYIESAFAWNGRIFDFFPREKAREIFAFLGDVARAGYSMIDINPSAFLFGPAADLKVVDFEFFARTSPAADFSRSKDYIGDFPGLPAPAKNGYDRYWYDALGGDLAFVMNASPARYAVRKAAHIVLYRVPRRTLSAAGALFKQARAQAMRLAGLRKGCLRI